jgi:hypothetical protein
VTSIRLIAESVNEQVAAVAALGAFAFKVSLWLATRSLPRQRRPQFGWCALSAGPLRQST